MTTADTFLVCWCLLTSSMWSVYASPSSMDSCKPYDFSGPSDVVFLIDRSESVNSQRFATYKKLISSLVTKAMKIGPDDVTGQANYSRIGVITFVAEAFIDLDLITDSRNVYSCEVFGDGRLFDRQVLYQERQKDPKSEGLQAALKKAPELLLQRPHIDRKLLFIISDFQWFARGTKDELENLSSHLQLRNHSLQVFGVGGGTYFNSKYMLDLFDSDNCTARSLDDWETYVEDLPSPSAGSSGLRVVTDNDLCCHLCGESSCRCKDSFSSFFHLNNSICRQSFNTCATTQFPDVGIPDPVIPEYAWTLLLAVMVILGGVVLVMAAMAGVLHWRRKRSRQQSADIGLSACPVTQAMTSDSSAAALEQPSAEGQSPRGPESSTLPQGNTIWNRRQQHPSPPPVRTTARALDLLGDPPPVPQHPPSRPVRQPATTPRYLYPESSTPSPHDSEMPYSYVPTIPVSVFFPSGNHSTKRVSSHAYDDTVDPRTVPRRRTVRDILKQIDSVRRNLSIWVSQR